ncbi:SWIM zinc finger family protein [Streptomyces mayonensis]|uniref:SWIM zinc finger family protein n=1 Tax=Streptomyces mayonensis TaxID=2750816 RepID=UPI0020A635AE|nr:SWIM zinc finger family protein [Streptomyces sp. A108]
MTPRPADEARRALREARLRGDTDPDGTPDRDDEGPRVGHTDTGNPDTDTGTGPNTGTDPDTGTADRGPEPHRSPERQPRPGDVARAALRSTRATQRHAATDTGAADAAKEEDEPDGGASGPAAPDPADEDGSRPADVAREALRAARRRAKAEAATGVRPRPGTPRHPQATAGSRTADARARTVRAFAAEAFRLPPDSDAGSTPDVQTTPHAGAGEAAARAGAGADAPMRKRTHEAPPQQAPTRRNMSRTTPTTATGDERPPSPDLSGPGSPDPAPAEARTAQGDAAEPGSVRRDAVGPDPAGSGSDGRDVGSDPPGPGSAGRNAAGPGLAGTDPVGLAKEGAEPAGRKPADTEAAVGGGRADREPAVGGGRANTNTAAGRGLADTETVGTDPATSQSVPSRSGAAIVRGVRDGEHRRTFPALPPRPAGAGLAGTWWGNAWVTALEEGALDAARLARGRGYAERGHVDAVTVTPGLVLAYVQGSRPRPYRVQVRLRTLGDDDWRRFLDTAVERPGHIAALLDKELPHSLADCGVPLLPGPGDLAPQCSCPDSGHPCKHAAALCYQTARLLDADPFVLLLLRGRGERELLDALSRLNAARAARAAQDRGPAPLPGVRAGAALTERALPPLPAPLPTPPHPEQPPSYPAAPGGPDPISLDQLATDAAARAHALLVTGRDPVGSLTLWQDAVRLAAARPGSGLTAGTRALYASLAGATGRDPAELARAVAAWRQGGPDGLDVLEEPWDPPAGRFDRARPLLLAADLPAFRPWRNRLTHPQGHVQLRLGRTGLWYAYESEPGREDWWPRGTPDPDPVGALTGLGGTGDV